MSCRHLQLPTHLRKTLPVKVTYGLRSQFQFMCWPSLLSLFVFGGGGGCPEGLRPLIYAFSSLWWVPWAIKRWIDAKRNGSCVQGSKKYSDALVRKFSGDISSMLIVARHPEMGIGSPCSLSWTREDPWISQGKGSCIKRRTEWLTDTVLLLVPNILQNTCRNHQNVLCLPVSRSLPNSNL